MRNWNARVWIFAVVFGLVAVRPVRADVCVSIDEAHDTLSAPERKAAVLVLEQKFEAAGQRVGPAGCTESYLIAHVRLGAAILVTLTGPGARREGRALGLEDLPALYDQMVRSIVTGTPMGAGVVDRTNVTEAQAQTPRRLQSDGFWYARLGYGATFADRTYPAPSLGFGYRGEFDSLGVDISFRNYSWQSSGTYSLYYGPSSSSYSTSLLKLQGIYFTNTRANRTPYVAGGVSWGQLSLHNGASNWDGNGLQGEVSAGYEIGRATNIKFFIQADAVLPLYTATSFTYAGGPLSPAGYGFPNGTTASRYTPALIVSFGIGGRRAR